MIHAFPEQNSYALSQWAQAHFKKDIDMIEIIAAARLLDFDTDTKLEEASGLEDFVLDHQARLDFLFDDASVLGGLLTGAPAVLSSSLIAWQKTVSSPMGDAKVRVELGGSGIDPVSSLGDLLVAVDKGVANGTLDSLKIKMTDGGKTRTVMDVDIAPTGLVVTSGNQSIELAGVIPTGIADAVGAVAALTGLQDFEALSNKEFNQLVAQLQGIGLSGLTVKDGDDTVLSLSLSGSKITLAAGELTLVANGTFPAGSLGQVVDLARDLLLDAEDGTLKLSDYPDLDLTSLTLSDAKGKLLEVEGEIGNILDETLTKVTVKGTGGNDNILIYDDISGETVLVQAGNGDDRVLIGGPEYGEYFGSGEVYPAPRLLGESNLFQGGKGHDTLIIDDSDFTFASQVIDLNLVKGRVFGAQYDGDTFKVGDKSYQVKFQQFEQYGILATGDIRVTGSDGPDRLDLYNADGYVDIDGGKGFDRLGLDKLFDGDGFNGMTKTEFRSTVTLSQDGRGGVSLFDNESKDYVGMFNRIEQIRFIANRNTGATEDVDMDLLVDFDLRGTTGDDSINGSRFDDMILGRTGNDVINGFGGSDLLNGGVGADTIKGGLGADFIYGNDGPDKLDGEDGNDVIIGGLGDDTVKGGRGNDTLEGGIGKDSVLGGAGKDSLKGGDGNDTMSGGTGNDEMGGGTGSDTMDGDNGNDFMEGHAGKDVMSGGKGNDVMDGGTDNDTLKGNAGNDIISGGIGNDVLEGGSGDDKLYGDGGNDTLRGDAGNDVLDGHFGADTYVFGANFGNDTILTFKAAKSSAAHDVIEFESSLGEVSDLAGFKAASTQDGTSIVYDYLDDGVNVLVIENTNLNKLTADDFDFG